MKKALACLDAVFLSRPVLWIPVWAFCGLGYWHGLSAGHPIAVTRAWGMEYAKSFAQIFLFSCSVGAVYVINQIADLKVDSLNKGFALLVKGSIGVPAACACAALLSVVSLALPLFWNARISLFSASALVLGVIYSIKPFYLTGRPVADFVSNATGYGIIAFGAGWILAGKSFFSTEFAVASAPYFLLMCAGSISSTLPDYNGDKAGDKRTTAVWLGPFRAHILALGLLVAAGGAALATRNYIACASSAVSFPVFILYAIKKSEALMEASYKVTGAVFVGLAACAYPVIVPFSALFLAATLAYFRLRHGVTYPSLVAIAHEE